MTRPYRPANGSEGSGFQAAFCNKCARDSEAHPCKILGATMAFGVESPHYPAKAGRQWRAAVRAGQPGLFGGDE